MLRADMLITVKTLFTKGYNKTQIANMLGIDRKTVRKALSEKDTVERKKKRSILDPYMEYINIQVSKKLSAMRIYQDMEYSLGYTGSYDTVKRYISKIKRSPAKPFMVLTSLPGEEAQVDFGYIGTIKLTNTKYKKAWVFVMQLSYSRYMYAKIVFNQDVATFIRCHKEAFRYFNGVPQSIKLDNLKAGVLEANFYEPAIQRNYASFASHYGFLPDPCRVMTPTDKGKVESNIKYIKENCFKGRAFKDNTEAEKFLVNWLVTIANNRLHGTTKKIPSEVFHSIEKPSLLPLPQEDYNVPEVAKCTVMANCHITYKGNYYSVPHEYIGDEISILAAGNSLKIFYREQQIAFHYTIEGQKGIYITDKNHYPHCKNITIAEIKRMYQGEIAEIGEYALAFFERFMEKSTWKYAYRTMAGILSLKKKYDKPLINNACHIAMLYNSLKYKTVKKICEQGSPKTCVYNTLQDLSGAGEKNFPLLGKFS